MNPFAVVAGIALVLAQVQCLPWTHQLRIAAPGIAKQQSNAQCDLALLEKCVAAVAAELNIPDLPSNWTAFSKILEGILDNEGLDGMKQICKAEEDDFVHCLGDQYTSCLTVDVLQSAGLSASDSYAYIGISYQLDYECTTGWDIIQRNWDCINSVHETHLQYWGQCAVEFSQKVANDPANLCQYEQELVACLDQPFKDACAPEVANMYCGAVQASYGAIWPQCTVSCPV